MKRFFIASFLLLASLTLAACASGLSFGPTLSPSPTVTWTPTASASLTPTSTATTTPTPTSTPTPIGGGLGRIVFQRGLENSYSLDVVNSDGTNHITLVDEKKSPYNPVWSAQGDKILFFTYVQSSFKSFFNQINPDGSDYEQFSLPVLWPDMGDPFVYWVSGAAVSPDGKKIILRVGRYDGSQPASDMFIADFDGINISNPVKLHRGESPVWSPDGSKIVFVDYIWHSHIFTINADGSNPVNLTLPIGDLFNNSDPSWSPDGKKIIFNSARPDGLGIYIMNSDGTDMVMLYDVLPSYSYSFSPDGKKIAFARMFKVDNIFRSDICTMNVDGTDIVTLVDCGVDICFGTVWSP